MEYFAGLDVSVRSTSICVVNADGTVVLEVKVATEPAAIAEGLKHAVQGGAFKRVGLEAGPLSQWLYAALATMGFPVVCVETRHMKAALSAQINKSDRNDARGIAHMMRVGLYKPVHVKTLESQERRMLLASRKLLVGKMFDIERELRATLRNFGLKVGQVSAGGFEARVAELVAAYPRLAAITGPMLAARRALREQYTVLHRMLIAIAHDDPVCRRLMTVPGIGPVVSVAYRSAVDIPERFPHSKTVGASVGLTPRRYQSGDLDHSGHISRCGDAGLRVLLYEAAQSLLTVTKKWSWLKAWAVQVAKRRGLKRAIVALSRRLAVILHRIWVDGTEFNWSRPAAT